VLVLGSAAAQATVVHEYLSRITDVPVKGPPPGEEPVESPGPFSELGGMAVDGGELYVFAGSSTAENIDKFDAATGAFVAQFPKFPSPSTPPSYFDFHQGFAVGHGGGEVEEYIAGDENTESGPKGLLAVFNAGGKFQGVWNGSDTPSKGFGCFECGGLGGVAADSSGNPLTNGLVYVLDPSHDVVDVFEPKAGGGEKYLTQLTGPEPGVPFTRLGAGASDSIAVDQSSGDVLVLDGQEAVDIFEPTALGEYTLLRRLTGTPGGAFQRATGVAVDASNGDIYVLEEGRGLVDQFDSTGGYLGYLTGRGTLASSSSYVVSMAIDPTTHDLYVGDRDANNGSYAVDVFGPDIVIPNVSTEAASSVKSESATLHGAVDPDAAGAATCRFEWGTSSSLGEVAPCEPEAVANGNSPVAVHANLSALAPDTTYFYRLQASNANGTNPGEAYQDQQFTTPGPGIHQESAANVTSASATLGASIDPDNAPTSYYFQYGKSLEYETSLPAAPGVSLGFGKGDVAVSVHLQGLTAGTVYHYRVVAVSNPGGEAITAEGRDQTFTTQAGGAEIALPDGRQWEMVSPPNKQGAAINAIGVFSGSDIQAAANGGGITYTATAPFVANPAGSRSVEATQVLSTRSAPGSWATSDISLPHNNGTTPLGNVATAEYMLFSEDLSLGFAEPRDNTPLPPLPANSEQTVYLRNANNEYEALVTAANVPPGTEFGGAVHFITASPDLGHVVLGSEAQLTSTPRPTAAGQGIYEWSAGHLQTVSILPDGEAAAAVLGRSNEVVRHAVSDDGSRLIWSPSHGGHLYLRDMARKESVAVDAAQGAPEPASIQSRYMTASADGSRVFFLSENRLTSDSTAGSGPAGAGEDLYVFEVTSGSGEALAGKLRDLSVDGNVGEGTFVKNVIGASEDGSYVYFVAQGALSNGAESGDNLYMVHYDAATSAWGAPVLIAGLSSEDELSWGQESGNENLANMTSRVSPNGRFLAFMSQRSLTGYENRDVNSDMPDEEVFLYDAETRHLACASCNPTGARPAGKFMGDQNEALETLVDQTRFNWNERWLAGNVPGWTNISQASAMYQSRYLSDSGRLFFNSSDALVPADVNGKEDVYEYEPEGVGSCQGAGHGQSASVVYEASTGGCVGLISAGTSSEESAFIDASETGGDVFFLTLSRLSPSDQDTSLDLYDAHECSASAPCAPPAALTPPPCSTGDSCKAAPTPQPAVFGAPSSETFSGAGNIVPAAPVATVAPRATVQAQKLAKALKACRNKPKRVRAGCERQARKKLAAKPSRAASGVSTTAGR
jgi:WD40-like Beta Propeller Repeat